MFRLNLLKRSKKKRMPWKFSYRVAARPALRCRMQD